MHGFWGWKPGTSQQRGRRHAYMYVVTVVIIFWKQLQVSDRNHPLLSRPINCIHFLDDFKKFTLNVIAENKCTVYNPNNNNSDQLIFKIKLWPLWLTHNRTLTSLVDSKDSRCTWYTCTSMALHVFMGMNDNKCTQQTQFSC